jgi:hypothetical protein
MAQQMIQSTIALGLGQISSGNQLMQTGGAEISAADQALLAAGQAQVQLDTTYSTNLTNAFGAIGKMFGMSALAGGGSSAGGSGALDAYEGVSSGGITNADLLASLALV